jgi:hypothetical protein
VYNNNSRASGALLRPWQEKQNANAWHLARYEGQRRDWNVTRLYNKCGTQRVHRSICLGHFMTTAVLPATYCRCLTIFVLLAVMFQYLTVFFRSRPHLEPIDYLKVT